MGYRLYVHDVTDENIKIYGTKYYRYIDEDEILKTASYRYLCFLKKVSDPYQVCFGADFTLNCHEYRIFIAMYIGEFYAKWQDFEHRSDPVEIFGENFVKLFESETDKYITWL